MWGQEGGSPGEKAREAGEEIVGSVGPDVVRTRRNWENFATFCYIFRNRNGTNRREPLQKGMASGSKSYGKREKKIQEAGVSVRPVPPRGAGYS